ncbi:cytosine deaminase [Raoultella ornithinolytica]|nr:cytosine deaminase [Raoultella ornithinolytica]
MKICSAVSISLPTTAPVRCASATTTVSPKAAPANLLILDAHNDYDAVRRQAKVLTSIRHGKIIMQRQAEQIHYPA